MKGATGFEQERGDSHASTTGQAGSSSSVTLPRYVIITANSNDIIMSGHKEDLQHAQKLRATIKGDFIWFRRGENSYIITDPAFIANAKALFAPEKEIERKQKELSREEAAASSQNATSSKQVDTSAAKTPLSDSEQARRDSAAAERDAKLAQSQGEIARQQGELARLQSDSARRASLKLRDRLEEALAKGIARLE